MRFAAGLVTALALIAVPAVAKAQQPPGFPALFYGSLVVDGEPPAEGSKVTAFIEGTDCTQANSGRTAMEGGVAVYSVTVMHESQRAGCGANGKTVTFRINEGEATQTATWRPGTQQVNLSIGSQAPPPLPTPTSTSTPDPTEVVATQTQEALFTPVPAPSQLPTDEPNVIGAASASPDEAGQATPGTAETPASSTGSADDGSGGGGVVGWTIGILAVVAIAGAVGGVVLSRRRAKVSEP